MKPPKQKNNKPVPKNLSDDKSVKGKETFSLQKLDWKLPSFIAIVAFVLYANTLQHGYVLDDAVAITNNQLVQKGFDGIGGLLTVDFWHFSNLALGYYRPLALITFAIEHQLFGSNPHISHLINIILYAFSGFMLCLLLQELFSKYKKIFPFLICALFIAHPIHTEVVANLKSRDEILSFLGVISVLFLMLRYDGHSKKYYLIAAVIIYYLAFLSKETAITLIILLPACFYFLKQKSIVECIIKTIPFVLIMMLFYYQKHQILGEASPESFYELNNYPYIDAEFPSSMVLFAYAVKLLIFPHPLRYDYSYNQIPAATWTEPLALVGLTIFLLLIVLTVKTGIKKSIWGFSLIVFFVSFFPALAFMWMRGGILAERFLYAASLGFSIALVYLIVKICKIEIKIPALLKTSETEQNGNPDNSFFYHKNLLLITGLIFLVYSFKTIDRNKAWKDNLTLFTTDIVHSPNSTQNNRHCGNELLDKAMKEKDSVKKMQYALQSRIYLKKAVAINPRFGEPWGDLGRLYTDIIWNPDSAIYFYKRCIQNTPGAAITYSNLGVVYMRVNKYKLASYYFNKSVEINPTFKDGQNRAADMRKAGFDIHIYPAEEDGGSFNPQPPVFKMPVVK